MIQKPLKYSVPCNDLFRTNQVSFSFNQNGQTIEGKRINDTRRVGLTIRYNFGIKPKEEKKEGMEEKEEHKKEEEH